MHFANNQEYFRYLRSQPVEPERYEEPKVVKQVQKQVKDEREAQDGTVLQAD